MAISVRNLYELTKDKYKIKLIAGEEGLDNDGRCIVRRKRSITMND